MGKRRKGTKGRNDPKRLVRELLAQESVETFAPKTKGKKFHYKHHHDWEVDGVLISDHAVLRFLQHAKGVDVEGTRKEIIGDGRAKIIRDLKTCKVPIKGSALRLMVKDGLVVTILKTKTGEANDDA